MSRKERARLTVMGGCGPAHGAANGSGSREKVLARDQGPGTVAARGSAGLGRPALRSQPEKQKRFDSVISMNGLRA